MVAWQIVFTKRAEKDSKNIAAASLKSKTEELLASIILDPFAKPPPFEKLVGDLRGYYSRRINVQHRLVYEIRSDERMLVIISMFRHYQ